MEPKCRPRFDNGRGGRLTSAPKNAGLPARRKPGARHPSDFPGEPKGRIKTRMQQHRENADACPVPPLLEGEGHEPWERSELGEWGEGLQAHR